jgi:hypothetical protein
MSKHNRKHAQRQASGKTEEPRFRCPGCLNWASVDAVGCRALYVHKATRYSVQYLLCDKCSDSIRRNEVSQMIRISENVEAYFEDRIQEIAGGAK